jgi:hypothetical protein
MPQDDGAASMTPNRCGDCKWYEPTRNPDTGRALTSKDGRCTYSVIWPELPKAFRGARFPVRLPVWRESKDPCVVWAPKAAPKAVKLQKLDL